MGTPRETEIKLELPPGSVSALKKAPLIQALRTPPKRATVVSVYFDTDGRELRKHGLTLRVRRSGNRYVQTIKATGNGGLLERDEWESEIASDRPDVNLARGTALEPLLNSRLERRLKPLFETRVRRAVYPLADTARAIELTVDQGRIDTGRKSMPLCEIELELERGNPEALFEVAREVARALPVQIAFKSKSERGYQLLDGEQNAPIKAASITLGAGSTTRDGFKVIGRACLKQVVDNEPALMAGDAEGVHQMRVGVRRLRAAVSLFGDIARSAIRGDQGRAQMADGRAWTGAGT